MIHFEWPWVFLFLPLPLLVYRFVPPAETQQQSALRVPFLSRLKADGMAQSSSAPKTTGKRIICIFLWLLLVAGAAKPQRTGDPITLPAKGRDLMLAVDISKSMEYNDLFLKGESVDRFTAVKSVLDEFIPRRKTDRLGLILFGSQAYIQTPLTFDHKTMQTLLNEAYIGMAGPQTAIGDAIGFAVKRLKEQPSESRVLILLTDGANTAGELTPLQATQLAKQIDLKIYTIGVGAEKMRIPGVLGTSFGARTVNPSADLDEETLQEIADVTGGAILQSQEY